MLHYQMLTSVIWFFMQFQEKQDYLIKLSKEEEEIQRQLEKQRQTEQKAQQKYKVWLQKKNQEKIELEKKEKVMLIIFSSGIQLLMKQSNSDRSNYLDRRRLP